MKTPVALIFALCPSGTALAQENLFSCRTDTDVVRVYEEQGTLQYLAWSVGGYERIEDPRLHLRGGEVVATRPTISYHFLNGTYEYEALREIRLGRDWLVVRQNGLLLSHKPCWPIYGGEALPTFDEHGDFRTARAFLGGDQVNHLLWTVVDPDPAGLNCRNGAGRVVAAYPAGAVLEAQFLDDGAFDAVEGTRLRVRVQRGDGSMGPLCFVRANTRYVLPLLH